MSGDIMNKKIILLFLFSLALIQGLASALWIGTNGVPSSSCTYTNTNCYWENSSQIFQNVTNSVSPIGAISNTINTGLPWFWPAFPFILYLYLFIIYSDSPSGGKLYMIAALVFVISIFMAFGGLILDALINLVIFIIAFILSNQFKHL